MWFIPQAPPAVLDFELLSALVGAALIDFFSLFSFFSFFSVFVVEFSESSGTLHAHTACDSQFAQQLGGQPPICIDNVECLNRRVHPIPKNPEDSCTYKLPYKLCHP